MANNSPMKIAVAGTGYVGLSLAVLLSQHNEVHALDIVPEKVEKINGYVSPIQAPTTLSSPRPPTTTATGTSSTRAPSRPPSPQCAR